MEINEAIFIKELMDGKGQCMADAEDGAKGLGAETQMGDLPQVFEAGSVL